MYIYFLNYNSLFYFFLLVAVPLFFVSLRNMLYYGCRLMFVNFRNYNKSSGKHVYISYTQAIQNKKKSSEKKKQPVLSCIQSFQILSAFCSLYLNQICTVQNFPHLLQHIFLCRLRVVIKCFLDEGAQNVLCKG